MALALSLHEGLNDEAQAGEAEVDFAALLGTLALGVGLGLPLASGQVNEV